MIGQIVNYRYEVLEKIGDGAYFAVYKARDKVLNRLVSLKILAKQYADNREFAAAIVEGYQSAASLNHVNIARVFETDYVDSQCFVACEYARGISVKERVHRAGAMAVAHALDIIIPVLKALEYAHTAGMPHGDIRPEDVIVSPDNEVKLTDFGLWHALDKCPNVADANRMRSIHYQAPELAEGAAPSAASDIYSVGVVLYEMVTSALPHDGPTAVSIALKKVKEPAVSPRSINAAVPKSLSDAIMKAIDTAPENRYKSAAEMAADLRAVREMLQVGQRAGLSETTVQAPRSEGLSEEIVSEGADRSIRNTYLALLALFLSVVVIVGSITWYVVKPRGEIVVPRGLLGKTWEEAVDIARESGIELVDDGRVPSDVYKEGTICSVIPPGGSTVPRDNPIVKVRISSGASYVIVPDLKGMSEADAVETAAREGFVIGKIKQQYSDDVPINSVISQSPEAGVRRPPNSAIDIVISQGPRPVQRPVEQPSATTGERRQFNVAVEVPEDAESSVEVMIKVNDDRGEVIEYNETRYPGDKFTVPIETQGRRARIRVYVGGDLISDATY